MARGRAHAQGAAAAGLGSLGTPEVRKAHRAVLLRELVKRFLAVDAEAEGEHAGLAVERELQRPAVEFVAGAQPQRLVTALVHDQAEHVDVEVMGTVEVGDGDLRVAESVDHRRVTLCVGVGPGNTVPGISEAVIVAVPGR